MHSEQLPTTLVLPLPPEGAVVLEIAMRPFLQRMCNDLLTTLIILLASEGRLVEGIHIAIQTLNIECLAYPTPSLSGERFPRIREFPRFKRILTN